MLNPQLVQFVQQSIRQGYGIDAIKQHLLQYGYAPADVDEACSFALGRQLGVHQRIEHHISFSLTTVVIVALIVIGLGAGGFLVYKISSPAPSQLLDLKVHPDKVVIAPGESIFFMRELSNYGSTGRYDIGLSYYVSSLSSGEIVASQDETAGIETLQSEKKELKLPTLAPGRYRLKTEARYLGRLADAGFEFSVVAAKPTCSDGMQNQAELGVDCGGPCPACAMPSAIPPVAQPLSCEDSNACTRDVLNGSSCSFEPIIPCCGNGVCEAGESSCTADCKPAATSVSPDTAIEQAKAVAKQDSSQAGRICESIQEERSKNRCFSDVAEISSQSVFCSHVASESMRNNCYMTLATKGDFSVCGKITNAYLQKSCQSLSQMGDLGGFG